jgi:hypothetical protein
VEKQIAGILGGSEEDLAMTNKELRKALVITTNWLVQLKDLGMTKKEFATFVKFLRNRLDRIWQ